MILGLDHVQVPILAGGENRARNFYGRLLGLPEVAKPESLAGRGGVWFQCGGQQIHCGVEKELPRTRRHPALLTDDLDGLRQALADAGYPIREEPEVPGFRRFFSEDPFGNRIELLERAAEKSAEG
jgi:catechol 2,3-dioxygenase-like lactoylglutathione lyase family enzyme